MLETQKEPVGGALPPYEPMELALRANGLNFLEALEPRLVGVPEISSDEQLFIGLQIVGLRGPTRESAKEAEERASGRRLI